MPGRDNPAETIILSTLKQVSTSTEVIEEKVEILHPLLELLREPDPDLTGYAERIIQLMISYEQRIRSLETEVSGTREALDNQSKRLDHLLSFLENPAPE